jgi:outer membrane receptor for monomeric catechols
VTRYDYQKSDTDNVAFPGLPGSTATTSRIRSGETTRHVFSENVTWNALESLYLQGGVPWIHSKTDTPASGALPGMVPDWDNNYWSLSLNAGYALNKRTALHAAYNFYHADNYPSAVNSVPYGMITDEHALTLTLNQRINNRMAWNASYGYYHGDDDAAGGYNDYEAHVLSTGFRYSF